MTDSSARAMPGVHPISPAGVEAFLGEQRFDVHRWARDGGQERPAQAGAGVAGRPMPRLGCSSTSSAGRG